MKMPTKKSSAKSPIRAAKAAKKRSPHRVTRILKNFDAPDISDADFTEVQQFFDLDEEQRVSRARKIISESVIEGNKPPTVVFPYAIETSQTLLPGYATLDARHRAEINTLISDISTYLGDSSRRRPFNCLMLAAPGAGKSHFIKKLAKKMEEQRVEAVTFNMATMQSNDDMAQPVDELRNVKVNDRFPLLFLDEFDSDPSRYAALLPLLWDGELHLGHRNLKLGKAVIILAGSNPDLPKVMDQSAKMQLQGDTSQEAVHVTGKLIDLLSRINGGIINLPDLDLRSQDRDRRVDKVCVAVTLLQERFGSSLTQVPVMLLRFIAQTQFRYGVRSIAHLVELIDRDALRSKVLSSSSLRLPLGKEEALRDSSLKLHLLDKDQAFGIVNRWKEFAKDRTVVGVRTSRLFTRLATRNKISFRVLNRRS